VYDKNNKTYSSSGILSVLDEIYLDTIATFNEGTWEEAFQVIENEEILFPSEN
jgi:hypothetical protein